MITVDSTVFLQILHGFSRQMTGSLILALIYLSVKPVAKQLACLLIRRDLRSLNKQPFTPDSQAKIFVDLFGKVGPFIKTTPSLSNIQQKKIHHGRY